MTKTKKLDKKFTKNDWDHMHDCIVDITERNCTREELQEIFKQLPSELKHEAYDWGMSDTLWRDKFCAWYEENMETEIWNEENINKVKEFINKKLDELSPEELKERKIFLELLVKKYREEDESRT